MTDLMSTIFGILPLWPSLIAFAFVVVLLLATLIYTRLHWVLKTMMILWSVLVFAMAYNTLLTTYGWPYPAKLPEKFQILWIDIQEPSGLNKGAIRYWLRITEPINLAKKEPRAYEVPYSKERHRQSQEIMNGIRNGKPAFGQRKSESERNGQGENGLNPFSYNEDANGFDIEQIKPPESMPPKDDDHPVTPPKYRPPQPNPNEKAA